MPTEQILSCTCGQMEWAVQTDAGTRLVCHCKDCQSFATHLSADTTYLDPAGGTHVYHTLPDRVEFRRGVEHLALLRLSPTGLMRWYASCCNTPIAATLPRAGIPFLGLVLRPETDGFGKIVARAFTDSARRPVKTTGMARAGLGILSRAITGRLSGAHRRNPFYDADGAPIRKPVVLTKEQRAAARPS